MEVRVRPCGLAGALEAMGEASAEAATGLCAGVEEAAGAAVSTTRLGVAGYAPSGAGGSGGG